MISGGFVRFPNMILCYFVRFPNMISGGFVRFSNMIPGYFVRFSNMISGISVRFSNMISGIFVRFSNFPSQPSDGLQLYMPSGAVLSPELTDLPHHSRQCTDALNTSV